MHALFSTVESAADQGGAGAIQQAAKAQGLALSPPEAAYLTKGGKRRGLEKALSELFERTLTLGVTGPGVLQSEQSSELIVRRRSGEQAMARDQVLSYAQYLQRAGCLAPTCGTGSSSPSSGSCWCSTAARPTASGVRSRSSAGCSAWCCCRRPPSRTSFRSTPRS